VAALLLPGAPGARAGDPAVARTLLESGKKALANNRTAEAVTLLRRAQAEDAGPIEATYWVVVVLCALGEGTEALEWAGRVLEIDPDEPLSLYNVACIYARLGRADDAIHCLERSVRDGYAYRDWIAHDSDPDPLREHPRFKALLEGLR